MFLYQVRLLVLFHVLYPCLAVLVDEPKCEQTALNTPESSTKQRLPKVESFLGCLTQWPGGFYALLQPKTGCPVDLAFFGGAHAFLKLHTQTGKTNDPANKHSSAFSELTAFDADKKNFLSMQFCEVNKDINPSKSWPEGSYCIHKLQHKDCPLGFDIGMVAIDTEDTNATGDGRSNVADTVRNPWIWFCCKNSGPASTPTKLPTGSPFLLYRYGGECQAIQGMNVSREFLQINTEDTNNGDILRDSHPDIDQPGSSVLKFNLCYYTKL